MYVIIYEGRLPATLFFSLITRCSSEIVSIFMKLKSRCTFVGSVVLLLIGVDTKTWSLCYDLEQPTYVSRGSPNLTKDQIQSL